MNISPIHSIKINVPARTLRVKYVHPEDPSEDLCIEIGHDKCDLLVLQDFLSACFPKQDFSSLSLTKAKAFCRVLYQDMIDSWLKSVSHLLLQKAALIDAEH